MPAKVWLWCAGWCYWVWLGVRHRENLRFARTKIWGVVRNLFRAVGMNLYKLGMIKTEEVRACVYLLYTYWYCLICLMKDVFYLTVDELFAYVEGRSVTNNLTALADLRKKEWSEYKKVWSCISIAHVHMWYVHVGIAASWTFHDQWSYWALYAVSTATGWPGYVEGSRGKLVPWFSPNKLLQYF